MSFYKTSLLSIGTLLLTSYGLMAQEEGWQSRPDGIEYRYLEHGTGTDTPQVGYTAEMRVIFKSHDSVIVNTDELNNGNPVPQVLTEGNKDGGDVIAAFRMMKKGDKIEFRLLSDSLEARIPQTKGLPYLKPGTYLDWTVTMIDFKSPETIAKEKAAAEAQQATKDEQLILEYIRQHHYKVTEVTAKTQLKASTKVIYKDTAGFYYLINKKGTGTALPQKGEEIAMNYTGKLLNGDKFDSNTDSAFHHTEPLNVQVGVGRVIKGWDLVMGKMAVGDNYTIILPSRLAYGERSAGPKIGANSVLVFDMERVEHQARPSKAMPARNQIKMMDASKAPKLRKINTPAAGTTPPTTVEPQSTK